MALKQQQVRGGRGKGEQHTKRSTLALYIFVGNILGTRPKLMWENISVPLLLIYNDCIA